MTSNYTSWLSNCASTCTPSLLNPRFNEDRQ
jgi:hypothetical protein